VSGGGGVVVPDPEVVPELERVTVSRSVYTRPALSYIVISIPFDPEARGMLAIAQLVVPVAVPLLPVVAFSHTTRLTVPLTEAVPVRLMVDWLVVYVVPVVGVTIETPVVTVPPVPPVGGGGVVVPPPVDGGGVVVPPPVLPVLELHVDPPVLDTLTVRKSTPSFPAASIAVM
jgi:hypothetical protein